MFGASRKRGEMATIGTRLQLRNAVRVFSRFILIFIGQMRRSVRRANYQQTLVKLQAGVHH